MAILSDAPALFFQSLELQGGRARAVQAGEGPDVGTSCFPTVFLQDFGVIILKPSSCECCEAVSFAATGRVVFDAFRGS